MLHAFLLRVSRSLSPQEVRDQLPGSSHTKKCSNFYCSEKDKRFTNILNLSAEGRRPTKLLVFHHGHRRENVILTCDSEGICCQSVRRIQELNHAEGGACFYKPSGKILCRLSGVTCHSEGYSGLHPTMIRQKIWQIIFKSYKLMVRQKIWFSIIWTTVKLFLEVHVK